MKWANGQGGQGWQESVCGGGKGVTAAGGGKGESIRWMVGSSGKGAGEKRGSAAGGRKDVSAAAQLLDLKHGRAQAAECAAEALLDGHQEANMGCCMSVSWLLHGCLMAEAWLSLGCCMAVS
eukprot:365722-Chlamydomonas_euryale.AAC.3